MTFPSSLRRPTIRKYQKAVYMCLRRALFRRNTRKKVKHRLVAVPAITFYIFLLLIYYDYICKCLFLISTVVIAINFFFACLLIRFLSRSMLSLIFYACSNFLCVCKCVWFCSSPSFRYPTNCIFVAVICVKNS